MPALTARESARYGVRLFGYLLAATLLGGAFVAAGAGVALSIESTFFEQLTGDAGTNVSALAAFGALSGIGVLVVLAGFGLVVFTAVADAVRIGTNRAPSPDAAESTAEGETTATTEGGSTDEQDGESESTHEDADESLHEELSESTPDETSEPTDRVEEDRPVGGQVPGTDPNEGDSDPFAEPEETESYDPTEPMDDPHEAQTNPFGEPSGEQPDDGQPSTTEEWTSKTPPNRREDGEAWREEIEAKLDGEERDSS